MGTRTAAALDREVPLESAPQVGYRRLLCADRPTTSTSRGAGFGTPVCDFVAHVIGALASPPLASNVRGRIGFR